MRHVRAGEDQEQPEDDVVEHGRLADAKADRAAQIRPSPVQENVETKMTSAIAGQRRDGHVDAEDAARETSSENAATNIAFAITGMARPRKSGSRPAGRDEDVRQRLLVALARDRLGHREEARDRRVLDGVADHVELVRLDAGASADVDEQQDLEDRARRPASGRRSRARAS